MKRSIVIGACAAVLAGGALAAMPLYVGQQAERAIQGFGQTSVGDLQVSHRLERYDSGYAAATAEGVLSFALPSEQLEVSFAVQHRVRHGIAGATIETAYYPLAQDDEIRQLLRELFGEGAVFHSETRVGRGGADIGLLIPAHRSAADAEVELVIEEARGEFVIAGQQLSGGLRLPLLRLQADGAHFELVGQSLEFATADRHDAFSQGSFGYGVERLDVGDAEDRLTATDVQLQVRQSPSGMLLEVANVLSIGSLTAGGGTLEQLSLSLDAVNLHRGLLEALGQLDAEAPLAEAALAEAVQTFLQASPSVSARLVAGPGGERGSLAWSLGYDAARGGVFDLENPFAALDGLQTQVLLDVSNAGLLEFAQLLDGEITLELLHLQLASLVEDGYVVRTETGYQGAASFADGGFTINERPRPELLMLLGMLLMSSGF